MGNLPAAVSHHKGKNRELERYCKPTGLYPSCPWEEKTVRKWILEGKVAPRFPPLDNPDDGAEECPICFMFCHATNTTVCCGKPLCTECYLQLRPPRVCVDCPFCNSGSFAVSYSGPLSADEKHRRLQEEQRVIEAKIRAAREEAEAQQAEYVKRQSESRARATSAAAAAPATVSRRSSAPISTTPPHSPGPTARGRAGAGGRSQSLDVPLATALATVDSRRQLESEMRRQHLLHPTVPPPAAAAAQPAHRRSRTSVDRFAGVSGGDADGGMGAAALGPAELLARIGRASDMQQLEDTMLMEAIRLSVLDEQRRREAEAARSVRAASAAAAAPSAAAGASAGEERGGRDDSGVASTFADVLEEQRRREEMQAMLDDQRRRQETQASRSRAHSTAAAAAGARTWARTESPASPPTVADITEASRVAAMVAAVMEDGRGGLGDAPAALAMSGAFSAAPGGAAAGGAAAPAAAAGAAAAAAEPARAAEPRASRPVPQSEMEQLLLAIELSLEDLKPSATTATAAATSSSFAPAPMALPQHVDDLSGALMGAMACSLAVQHQQQQQRQQQLLRHMPFPPPAAAAAAAAAAAPAATPAEQAERKPTASELAAMLQQPSPPGSWPPTHHQHHQSWHLTPNQSGVGMRAVPPYPFPAAPMGLPGGALLAPPPPPPLLPPTSNMMWPGASPYGGWPTGAGSASSAPAAAAAAAAVAAAVCTQLEAAAPALAAAEPAHGRGSAVAAAAPGADEAGGCGADVAGGGRPARGQMRRP